MGFFALNSDRLTALATVVIAVFTFVLAFTGILNICVMNGQLSVMSGQLTQMSQQYQLEKRHTEDSDEAICTIRQDIVLGENLDTITIANNGKISAHGLQAHIEISRNSLPDIKRIALLKEFDVSADELRVQGPPIIRETILSPIDWEKLYGLNEAIVMNGQMTYDNGFGDQRTSSFCQAYVVEPATQHSLANGKPVPLGALPDCDRLPETLKRFADWVKEDAAHQKPN